MPPLRFHCLGGCWDRSRTVATLALAVRHSITIRLHLINCDNYLAIFLVFQRRHCKASVLPSLSKFFLLLRLKTELMSKIPEVWAAPSSHAPSLTFQSSKIQPRSPIVSFVQYMETERNVVFARHDTVLLNFVLLPPPPTSSTHWK